MRAILFFAASTIAGCAVGAPNASDGVTSRAPDVGVEAADESTPPLFDADPPGDDGFENTTDAASTDASTDTKDAGDRIDASDAAEATIDTAPLDRCAKDTDGAYCASRFSPSSLDVHALVHCKGGVTASIDTCIAGCVTGATGADTCHADPCVTAKFGGKYCGQSTEEGFGGGLVDWIYDCEGGKTASSTPCAKGCKVEPAGTEDMCL